MFGFRRKNNSFSELILALRLTGEPIRIAIGTFGLDEMRTSDYCECGLKYVVGFRGGRKRLHWRMPARTLPSRTDLDHLANVRMQVIEATACKERLKEMFPNADVVLVNARGLELSDEDLVQMTRCQSIKEISAAASDVM